MLCELDRKASHAACSTLDQDSLARLKLQGLIKRTHSGEPREGHGGRFDVGHVRGLPPNDPLLESNLLGVAALATLQGYGEDCVSRAEDRHRLADGCDRTGHVAAEN